MDTIDKSDEKLVTNYTDPHKAPYINELLPAEKMALVKKVCSDGFLEFCVAAYPGYQPSWFHEVLANKLQGAYERVERGEPVRLIIETPPRHGKLLYHKTPVLSKDGWKNHGDLVVGDYVFGPDGKPKIVQGLSSEGIADYIVTFSDGSEFYTHGNHEWVVYDRKKDNKLKKVYIKETKELLKDGLSVEGIKGKRGYRYRYFVDTNVKIEFTKQKLPIHPYTLGVWLGGGDSSKAEICGDKKDKLVINKVDKYGWKITSHWVHKITGVNYYGFSGKKPLLKNLNLLQNKHIPYIYKFSSIEQRLELLAGLIDTYGSRDKRSRYRFSSCNKRLVDDVKELVTSLGGRAYIMEYEPVLSSSGIQGRQTTYQVSFNLDLDIPVALSRKINTNKDYIKRKRSIISIEKATKPKTGRCIQVEGGVYLVGKNLIPTHNSQTASILFPAWVLGKNPKLPVILASYSADLAEDFGMKTRDLVGSDIYKQIFSETVLRQDTAAKAKWLTTKGGGYTAVGVGGAVTGKGGKIMIIDDPFKNRQDADSETMQEMVWSWYQSTFYTRQEGITAIIVIATRWSLNDLIGKLLDQQKELEEAGVINNDKWEVIRFPAIAEEDEKYRKVGESLWPEKFSIKQLENIRNNVSVYEWSSLYQQNPILQENAEFQQDWFQYYTSDELKTLSLINYTFVDPAISQKRSADNTVVRTISKDRVSGKLYLREETAGRMDPLQTIDAIFHHAKTYRSRVWVEAVAYQAALQTFVIQEQQKRKFFFEINQLTHKNTGSKSERIRGLIPLYKAGMIFHTVADKEYERELLAFPKGRRDDRLDAVSFINLVVDPTMSDVGVGEERVDFDPFSGFSSV